MIAFKIALAVYSVGVMVMSIMIGMDSDEGIDVPHTIYGSLLWPYTLYRKYR